MIHLASALDMLVVGIAAGCVLVSELVHGGNVMWTLFGAVVTAVASGRSGWSATVPSVGDG